MPGVPETAWGVWGEPEPIKAWEPGAPKVKLNTSVNRHKLPNCLAVMKFFLIFYKFADSFPTSGAKFQQIEYKISNT